MAGMSQDRTPRRGRFLPPAAGLADPVDSARDIVLAVSRADHSRPQTSMGSNVNKSKKKSGRKPLPMARWLFVLFSIHAVIAIGAIPLNGADGGQAGLPGEARAATAGVEDGGRFSDSRKNGGKAAEEAQATSKNTLKSRIYVNATPPDGRIRILNIVPPYRRGMVLDPGSYAVEVSKDGYETEKRWVILAPGEDRQVSIRLEKYPEREDSGPAFTNTLGMTFVRVPPGSFVMGSPETEPGRDSDETQHRVTLTRAFYLQTTEVTQGQWRAVMGNSPSRFSVCGDGCPVERVSWKDCQEFALRLNGKEGTTRYRLPTEAEWEYACRSGTTGPYYDELDRSGWHEGNSGGGTKPVALKAPSAWGLYDMHGNVWEWCLDWYGNYPAGSVTDPEGPSTGSSHVCRGSSWSDRPRFCRSANRGRNGPSHRGDGLGFRLAASF